MYDWTREECDEYILRNSTNNFIYIEFTYKQLGRDENWFRNQCRELNNDTFKINREILLQWNKASDNAVFSEDQLNRLAREQVSPVATLMVNKYYAFNLYKDFDWRQPILLGIDAANGLERDNTAMTLVCAHTLEVLADFKNNVIDPLVAADIVADLVNFFPNITIIPENNGPGHGLIAALRRIPGMEQRLYYEVRTKEIEKVVQSASKSTISKAQRRVFGITTDKDSRPKMFDLLFTIVNDEPHLLKSPNLIDDISGLERGKSRIEHSTMTHDDNLMSYLVVRYAWTFGKNLHKFNIAKTDDVTRLQMKASIDEGDADIESLVTDMGKERARQMSLVNSFNRRNELDNKSNNFASTQIIDEFNQRMANINKMNNMAGIKDDSIPDPSDTTSQLMKSIFNLNSR